MIAICLLHLLTSDRWLPSASSCCWHLPHNSHLPPCSVSITHLCMIAIFFSLLQMFSHSLSSAITASGFHNNNLPINFYSSALLWFAHDWHLPPCFDHSPLHHDHSHLPSCLVFTNNSLQWVHPWLSSTWTVTNYCHRTLRAISTSTPRLPYPSERLSLSYQHPPQTN